MKDWTELADEMDAKERALTNRTAAAVRIRDCVKWEAGEVTFNGVDRETLREWGIEA